MGWVSYLGFGGLMMIRRGREVPVFGGDGDLGGHFGGMWIEFEIAVNAKIVDVGLLRLGCNGFMSIDLRQQ